MKKNRFQTGSLSARSAVLLSGIIVRAGAMGRDMLAARGKVQTA
jgi:hypothetical protein